MLTNLEKLENIIEEKGENYILNELFFNLERKNIEKIFIDYKGEKIYLGTIKYDANVIFSIYNINSDFELRNGKKIHYLGYTIVKKMIKEKILGNFLKQTKLKLFNKGKICIVGILPDAVGFWEKTAQKLKMEGVIKDYEKIKDEQMVFYI